MSKNNLSAEDLVIEWCRVQGYYPYADVAPRTVRISTSSTCRNGVYLLCGVSRMYIWHREVPDLEGRWEDFTSIADPNFFNELEVRLHSRSIYPKGR